MELWAMAGYEFEDVNGNRYRISAGAGPGFYHPENVGSGSSVTASSLLEGVPFDAIAGAMSHFWFDILNKIPGLSSAPGEALASAIASSYLTIEKLNTALAIDDEVEDNSAYLRMEIHNAMARIIAEEKREAAMYQRQMDKESLGNKALIYLGGFAYSVYQSGKDLALWLKEVSDLVNPIVRKQHHFRAMQAAWMSETPMQTYTTTYLEGEWRELVEVLGFDPSTITRAQLEEAMAMANLIWEDPNLKMDIIRFIKDYASAQHSIEITESVGAEALGIILTVVMVAVTAGAAIPAAGVRAVQKFRILGDLMIDFARTKRRVMMQKLKRGAKTSKREKLESVPVQPKKTDAHGAETGEVSRKHADRTLFRRDSRSPETIFAEGFKPHRPDANVPLEDYVDFNVPSQYVGTSKVRAGAAEVNTQTSKPGYIYEISDPGHGVDVNEAYPDNPFSHEQEIAFPGGIDACRIKGCTPIDGSNKPTGVFIENPSYGGVD